MCVGSLEVGQVWDHYGSLLLLLTVERDHRDGSGEDDPEDLWSCVDLRSGRLGSYYKGTFSGSTVRL